MLRKEYEYIEYEYEKKIFSIFQSHVNVPYIKWLSREFNINVETFEISIQPPI